MIRHIRLVRNIGQFDSVSTIATLLLDRLVLVYAENGRGKTTLAAILRSLGSGDPMPITERRRLAAANPPHVVIDSNGGPPDAMFQSGAWNRTLAGLAVFDDVFVDANIHSGLTFDARHRQNLHEVVLGTRGVTLSRRIQDLVSRIEDHNKALREKASAIPQSVRGGYSVDDFCALEDLSDVDARIAETERALAAAREHDAVRNTPLLEAVALPAFDMGSIEGVLQRSLTDLDLVAEEQVRSHLAKLNVGGEQWVADGMQHIRPESGEEICPFCAQSFSGVKLIVHYRAYFSDAYTNLKADIADALRTVHRTHGGDVPAGFERAVRVLGERRTFWSRFCDLPGFEIDTAAIVRSWSAAREAIVISLSEKQSAPLEKQELNELARATLESFETFRKEVTQLGTTILAANLSIRVVQEQAAVADPATLTRDLARLKASKARHSPEISALCDDYLREEEAKTRTEAERDSARDELELYKASALPASQTAINLFLQRFNAGFRLDSITSTATRGGQACTYSVIINETAIPVSAASVPDGDPSFRNTLSAGDRNTLALAFFFASLEQDPNLASAVIVIDDPISSLDDHRSWSTVQEVRRLSERAGQVIVLSHDKRFLCRLWEAADRTARTAVEMPVDRLSDHGMSTRTPSQSTIVGTLDCESTLLTTQARNEK
jgi:wobble nucleotide-excising tRNase